mgnify:CR=1 FL=1
MTVRMFATRESQAIESIVRLHSEPLVSGREASEAAEARLAVLEDISRPGAGFDIAMADRNRRGGGDILGEDQSGHLSALGPGYYRHLLRKAMMERRVKEVADVAPVHEGPARTPPAQERASAA